MVEEGLETVGSGAEASIVEVEDSSAVVVEDADVVPVDAEEGSMANAVNAESMDTCRRTVGATIKRIWRWVKWP